MTDTGPLDPLSAHLDALAERIAPGPRKKLAREVGVDLRSANRRRLRDNVEPDGSPMAPRKAKPGRLRSKRMRDEAPAPGRVRAGRMFRKAGKSMKVETGAGSVRVGWSGADGRIMGRHLYGGKDRVDGPGSPLADYPARAVLGLSDDDRTRILDRVMDALATH